MNPLLSSRETTKWSTYAPISGTHLDHIAQDMGWSGMTDAIVSSRGIAGFVDDLQSGGRYTFSFDETGRLGGSDVAHRSAIRRLKQKGRLASPRKGFLVIVPVEYRSTGAPPASWFVDDLMRHVGQPYYVGLLSAAAIHGAAHQHPQVFQVVTSKPTASASVGRVRLEFFRKRRLERTATTRVKTETGEMTVSTPEATAFDLVRHFGAAGHMGNVATVLSELAEVLDPGRLAEAAGSASLPEVQRAGYLLEISGHGGIAAPLADLVAARRARRVLLRTDARAGGMPVSDRWRLVVNERVEPDL